MSHYTAICIILSGIFPHSNFSLIECMPSLFGRGSITPFTHPSFSHPHKWIVPFRSLIVDCAEGDSPIIVFREAISKGALWVYGGAFPRLPHFWVHPSYPVWLWCASPSMVSFSSTCTFEAKGSATVTYQCPSTMSVSPHTSTRVQAKHRLYMYLKGTKIYMERWTCTVHSHFSCASTTCSLV